MRYLQLLLLHSVDSVKLVFFLILANMPTAFNTLAAAYFSLTPGHNNKNYEPMSFIYFHFFLHLVFFRL